MSAMRRRGREAARAAAIGVMLLLLGCAHGTLRPTGPSPGRFAERVGRVSVTLADDVPSDRRFEFKVSGAEDEYLKVGAGARFRSLAGALADRVADLFASAGP